jgi:hypothetical protein
MFRRFDAVIAQQPAVCRKLSLVRVDDHVAARAARRDAARSRSAVLIRPSHSSGTIALRDGWLAGGSPATGIALSLCISSLRTGRYS